jgi:hypothetical protein
MELITLKLPLNLPLRKMAVIGWASANFNKMIQTEFLALMHCGQFVDANLLEKGIYTCSKPFIYDKTTTIDSLKHQASLMIDMLGQKFVSDKYLSNLEQCQLVPISISVGGS